MQFAANEPQLGVKRSRRVRRDLTSITADGVFWSLMFGFGETYLIPFFLAAGVDEKTSGILATAPILVGAALQLISPVMIKRLGSYRRWVLGCATLQALLLLPLVGFALWGAIPVYMAFLIASLYQGAGMATGPAWNGWMGLIVPRSLRANFFANRSRAIQACLLMSLLAAGGLLELSGEDDARRLTTFALLFAFAAACRGASVGFLARQSEPPGAAARKKIVGPMELLSRMVHSMDGRLLAYMFSVQAANFVAAAYLPAYFLRGVGVSDAEYASLIALPFVSKMLLMPVFGRFAKRHGPLHLLWLAGVSLVPLAALLSLSPSYYYLLVVQMIAGGVWGAYELATFLMFFESMREEERTSLLTAHFFTNACAMTLGMLISRTLLEFWGAALPSYQSILLLSSLLMLFTLILLARVVSTQFPITPLAVRVLSVRLFSGSLDEPIVASIASARRTASRMRRLKPEAGRRPVTGRRRRPRRTR